VAGRAGMNRNLFLAHKLITQNRGPSHGTGRERQFNVVLGAISAWSRADSIGCSGLPWGTVEQSCLVGM
jgi:hypothetical protein